MRFRYVVIDQRRVLPCMIQTGMSHHFLQIKCARTVAMGLSGKEPAQPMR